MKNIVFSAFLVTTFLVSSTTFADKQFSTGKELLEYCQIAADANDRDAWKPQTEPEYILGTKAGMCAGYLMSATELNRFCFPPNYNLLLGAAVVVKYLKKHPEEQTLSAALLTSRAYKTYFPCVRV